MKIRVKEKDWNIIQQTLNRSFASSKKRYEWGVIAVVKKIGKPVFLITNVIEPERQKDIDCSKGCLRFSQNYIRRAQLFGRKINATGLIFFPVTLIRNVVK